MAIKSQYYIGLWKQNSVLGIQELLQRTVIFLTTVGIVILVLGTKVCELQISSLLKILGRTHTN